MTERIWDKFLTERDRAVLSSSGYGTLAGFGKRPALMIVDISYGFTGDKPEPILESIKRWSNSSGSEAWDAVAVVKDLADGFRARRLPVIYSTGVVREDNWDAGGWAWKNRRNAESSGPRQTSNLDPNQIVAELAPQPQDIVVYKQKPSAFFASNLMSYITLLGCDSLVVTGGTTSGCVRATVIDAFSYNLRLTVVEDGCFDRSQASHALNLFDMNAKYADVVPAETVKSFVATLPDDLFPNLPGRAA